MKKLKVIVVGAGVRGIIYSDIMAETPEKFEVIGVADPNESRRNYIRDKHNIPEEHCFDSWEGLLELPKFADIAIIGTMDRMHYASTMAAIRQGYDLLLEKPIAPTPEECIEIAAEAKKYGTKALIGHVLRYNSYFKAIKAVVDSGAIGEVMSVQHAECVGNEHQAHSFVRGNWGNSKRSSTMLLQKSCHDLDIIQWIVGKKCKRVSSFGSLSFFTRENAPKDAPEYCIEGCPHAKECCYFSEDIYLNTSYELIRQVCTGLMNPTDEDIKHALRTNIFGKCIYKCDNDVVDHQVVNMEFENGAVADFNMCAFNKGGRFIRVMGTKGEISRDGDEGLILYKFADKSETEIDVDSFGNNIEDGHGGGDAGIVAALYDYIANGITSNQLSEIDISVQNHMIAFAAEESRLSGKTVDIDDYVETLNK